MKFFCGKWNWVVTAVGLLWIFDNERSKTASHLVVDAFINPVGPLSKVVAGLLPPVTDKSEKDKNDQSGSLILDSTETKKVGKGGKSKGVGSSSSIVSLKSFSEPPGIGYYGNMRENDDQYRYQGPRPYDYTLNNELFGANSGFSGMNTGFEGMNGFNGMKNNGLGRMNDNYYNGFREPNSFSDRRGGANYPGGVGFGQAASTGIVGGEPPFDFDYNRRYNGEVMMPPPRSGEYDYTDSMNLNGVNGSPNLEYYDVGGDGVSMMGMSQESLREQLEQTRVALRGRTREVAELRSDLRALELQAERYEDYIEDLQEQLRMETGRDPARSISFGSSASRAGARTNESQWTQSGSSQKSRASDFSSRRGDYDNERKNDRSSRSSSNASFDFRDQNKVRTDGYGRDDYEGGVGRNRSRVGGIGNNSSSRTVSENRRNTVSDFREQNKVTTDGYGRSGSNSREDRNSNGFSTSRNSRDNDSRSSRSSRSEDRFNMNQSTSSSRRTGRSSSQSSSSSFDDFYGTNKSDNDGRSSSMFDWSKDENDRCDISDADTKRRFGQEAPYEGAKNINPNDTTWNSNTRGRERIGTQNKSDSPRAVPYDPSRSSSRTNFGSATSSSRSSSTTTSSAGVSLNGNMNGMDIFGLGKSSGPGLSVEEKADLFDTGAPGSTPSSAYTYYGGSSSTWDTRSSDNSSRNRRSDARVQMGGGDLLEGSRTPSMLEEAERSGYYGSSGSSSSSFRGSGANRDNSSNTSSRGGSFNVPDTGRDYSYSSHWDFDDSSTASGNSRRDRFDSTGGPSSSAYASRYQQDQSKGGSTNLGRSSSSRNSSFGDRNQNNGTSRSSSDGRGFDVDNDKYTRNTIYNMKIGDEYGNSGSGSGGRGAGAFTSSGSGSEGRGGGAFTNSGSGSGGRGGGAFTNSGRSAATGSIGNRGGMGSSNNNNNNAFVAGPASTSTTSSSTSSPFAQSSNTNSRNQGTSSGGNNSFESWMRGNTSNQNQGGAGNSPSSAPTSSPYVRNSSGSTATNNGFSSGSTNNGFSSGNWSRGNTSNQGSTSSPTSTTTSSPTSSPYVRGSNTGANTSGNGFNWMNGNTSANQQGQTSNGAATSSSPTSSPYVRNGNSNSSTGSNGFNWMNGNSSTNQQGQAQTGRNGASSTSTSQSTPPWQQQQQTSNQSSPWNQQQTRSGSSSSSSPWPGQTSKAEEPSGPIRGPLGFQ